MENQDKMLYLKRLAFISIVIFLLLGTSLFFTIHTPHFALNILLVYVGTLFGTYKSPKIYSKIWKDKTK